MPSVAICIPWRDRGRDPLRQANLDAVLAYWEAFDIPVIVTDDGRNGDAQFNRSAAYNRAAAQTDAEVLVYTESDMILPIDQILQGIEDAQAQLGLVVPFTTYRYITPADSQRVRTGELRPEDAATERIMANGSSIGAVNIVSRASLEAIGQWDEGFEGNWWDDSAMKRAFEICCGPTRWVEGYAHHLYHLPGWTGDHLTEADREATKRNKIRYRRYLYAYRPQEIRELTQGN